MARHSVLSNSHSSSSVTFNKSCFRNFAQDELSTFLKKDKVTFAEIKEIIINNDRDLGVPLVCFMIDNTLHLQSQVCSNGVPCFLIKITDNLHFETYYYGAKNNIPTISKNRVSKINTCSILEEILRYLKSLIPGKKEIVNHEHLASMSTQCVGTKIYFKKVIVRSF